MADTPEQIEEKNKEFKKIRKRVLWVLGAIFAGILGTFGTYIGNKGIQAYQDYRADQIFVHDSLRPAIGLMWSFEKATANKVDSLKADDGDTTTYVQPEIKVDTGATNSPAKLKEEIKQRTNETK